MLSSNVLIRAVLLAIVLPTSAITLAQSPKTATESGAISGVSESGLSIYKGIPFAAPPVGDLRWQPPAPVAPWKGTHKADAFAPACMQTGVSMPGEKPPAVNQDPWFRESVHAAGAPGDLRLVMNLETIVRTPYFRSYWIQRSNAMLKPYWAGIA